MAELDVAGMLLSELPNLLPLAALLLYIFAAGRIAETFRLSEKPISKGEALLAPFAYVFFAAFFLMSYFSSGFHQPPQDTIIANGVYLLLLPLAITAFAGALALQLFFHKRLQALQSLHLSLKIALAPIFDGLAGYFTGLGAAAVLVFISGASFWSSGGNFSLITIDFLLLSAVFAAFFAYRAIASCDSEGRASNIITAAIIIMPGVLRLFFKEIACALLSFIPLPFFTSCPLLQVGNEVTMVLSALATLVLIVPFIPIIYAVVVNLLRLASMFGILIGKSPKKAVEASG